MVILAGNPEKDLFIHTQGTADRNTRRAMSPDTVFDISSISKPLGTATGILLLADRGLLDLSDPFTRYLPQYKGKSGQQIDFRMLASHFSGIEPVYPRTASADELLDLMLTSEFPKPQWQDYCHFAERLAMQRLTSEARTMKPRRMRTGDESSLRARRPFAPRYVT